jgi:hypothetical protein
VLGSKAEVKAALVSRPLILAGTAFILWQKLWPSEVFHKPIGSLTLGNLFSALFWSAICLGAVVALAGLMLKVPEPEKRTYEWCNAWIVTAVFLLCAFFIPVIIVLSSDGRHQGIAHWIFLGWLWLLS